MATERSRTATVPFREPHPHVGSRPARKGRPGSPSGDTPGRTARSTGAATERAGLVPYLLILPGFVFYAAFVLLPTLETLRLSFFRWDGLMPQQFVGMKNYVEALTDPTTLSSFLVSLAFVFFGCILPVGVSLLLVGIIARSRQIKGLTLLRFVYFLPYTIALAVVAIAWRWLYATDGSINAVVAALFGEDAAVAYLGDPDAALPALGLVSFWVMFGFVVVMLLSGIQHIPRELFDAARCDGAGAIREFFTVTLPGMRGELRVSLVMTFIFALRTFDLPLMATQGGPGYATTTPSLLMYRDVFLNMRIGEGAAIAVMVTIIIGVGVAIINRAMSTKEH